MSQFFPLALSLSIIIGRSINKLLDAKILSFFFSERIQIFTGSSSQSVKVSIDLNSPCSWFFENQVDNYTSTSLRVIKPKQPFPVNKHDNISFNGNYVEDLFFLDANENISLFFPFVIITDPPTNYIGLRGALALPFTFQNISDSIVHALKTKGIIDHLSFGIQREHKDKLLRMGGLTEEDKHNKTYSFFYVLGRYGHWDCIISQAIIQFGANKSILKTNQSNNYAYLDTGDEAIIVPTDFFDLILAQFTVFTNSKLCELYIFNNKKRQLICLNHLHLLSVGTLRIEINNYLYSIQISDLWICESEDECELLIMDDPQYNHWKLGTRFYYKSNVLFDYQGKKVHFYSSDSIEVKEAKVPIQNNQVFIALILIVIILQIIGLVFIVTLRVLFKK